MKGLRAAAVNGFFGLILIFIFTASSSIIVGESKKEEKIFSGLCFQDLSPKDREGRWYFKITHKNKPNETLDVIGLIEYVREIDGEEYYFYGVPLENKGNLIRFEEDRGYIKRLKYPVFSFIFLDVELAPPVNYVRFPMTPGDEWRVESEGLIRILGLFNIRMKTNIRFEVETVENTILDGRIVRTYKVKNYTERGSDGKIFEEENWFGAGVGLMYQNTEAYTLELVRYEPGPDNRERFLELTFPAQQAGGGVN
ncbi:MAG TPA: hypothetical protein ENN43_05395 [bacterium]|nr:hypothetical protein [bacterium]